MTVRSITALVVPLLLAAACATPAPEDRFDALVNATGAEYLDRRADLLADPDAARALLDAVAARGGADDPRVALQQAILEQWLRDPEAMRQVYGVIEGWNNAPVAITVEGNRVLRAPLEEFGGQEDALTAALLEILLHSRDDPQFQRREQLEAVFYFLGDLRAEIAAPLLLAYAADQNESLPVRVQSLEALAAIGAPSTVRPLAGIATGDPEPGIRRLAVAALGDTESPEALPILQGIADDEEEDRRVVSEARAAIEYIGVYNEGEE